MIVVVDVLVFNDGHVLQLRSETVAVRRRKIYGLDNILWSYDNRGGKITKKTPPGN